MSEMDNNLNIRSKPTKMPNVKENTTEEDNYFISRSPKSIQEDLKASVVQMESIETVPSNKFKVKESPKRSPAPIPEAISPAGFSIDLEMKADEKNAGEEEIEFKIDFGKDVDLTLKGKNLKEYKRNIKGSLMILFLIFTSIILFTVHCTMFSMVVDFDSPELIIAAILYFISTTLIFVVLFGALIVPNFSINEEGFKVYYSPILVAGGIDFVAILLGGGVFGPLISSYSRDPNIYSEYTPFPIIMTIIINGALYYAFAKSTPNSHLFSYFHPFEKIPNQPEKESEKEPEIEEV